MSCYPPLQLMRMQASTMQTKSQLASVRVDLTCAGSTPHTSMTSSMPTAVPVAWLAAQLTLLRKEAPATDRDRYKHLSHSTIASWFDKNNKLTRKHQLELEACAAQPTGAGYVSPLAAADGAEGSIVEVLQEMRKAGTPLNTRIIRWVMHAILLRRCPEVLDKLQLSQSFISRWVRTHEDLQFRWRARTTTAGSLPDDWETQGMHMAMRIAAAMHLHKVSPKVHYSSRVSAPQLLN